ncbi:MAG: HAD family hydrolase [Candidatus Melainabacteria bacterium]|nr:HAD family hydrolase [Candidatus Melainabacteria bacterium]
MSFKGVLLDLDNTLYDYDSCHKPALDVTVEFLANQLKVSPDTVRGAYKEGRSQINKELQGQGSSHSRLLYFQRVCEILGVKPCRSALEAEEVYWDAYLSQMKYRPGVVEFLDVISDMRIAIVTDLTAQIQFRKLIHLNLANRIAAVVTSEESGAEKPNARIFNLALKKLGLASSEVCVIGDNWEKDIEGGIGLGMRSFWLSTGEYNNADKQHDLVVAFDSFEQLKQLMLTEVNA